MSKVNSEDRVLIIFGGGPYSRIQGGTALQKYAFLLHKQYEYELRCIADAEPKLKFYDDWKKSWGGPYSKTLDDDVKKCIETGTVVKTEGYRMPSFHDYLLTQKGHVTRIRMSRRFGTDMYKIDKKIEKLKKTDYSNLLSSLFFCLSGIRKACNYRCIRQRYLTGFLVLIRKSY